MAQKKGRQHAHKQSQPSRKRPADLIWGRHPVDEFLATMEDHVLEVFTLEQKNTGRNEEIIERCRHIGIACHSLPHDRFPLGPEVNHQGVCARIKPIQPISLEELLDRLYDIAGPKTLLALDCIQDPHNFGAIIRSAAAAGVQGILFPKDRSAPLSGTVTKISTGAIAKIPLCSVTNLSDALERLKETGFWVYGADADADQFIYQTDFAESSCLVIGGEGKGLRPLVKKHCDALVGIPMHSKMDSLNASVAAAVMMFEITRQRMD